MTKKKTKDITESTMGFSFQLGTTMQLENYPSIIEKFERVSDETIRLTLLIPVEKGFTDYLLRAIAYFSKQYNDGSEVLLIPTRRWAMYIAKKVPPEFFAKVFSKVLAERLTASLKEKKRKRGNEYIG